MHGVAVAPTGLLMAAPAASRAPNPFDQFDVVPAQPARGGNPWDNDPVVQAPAILKNS